MLVLYNTDTNNYYNGSPNTAIRSMVDQANTYYENSRVDIQLRLVGTDLIDLGDDASVTLLRNINTVQELRDSAGADFVTCIPNDFGGCGVGFLTARSSNAFNIVKRSCMARSYVHELGHNMGLGHSVAQNSRGSDYNYGIGFGVDSVFSTLMAYESAYSSHAGERICYLILTFQSTVVMEEVIGIIFSYGDLIILARVSSGFSSIIGNIYTE